MENSWIFLETHTVAQWTAQAAKKYGGTDWKNQTGVPKKENATHARFRLFAKDSAGNGIKGIVAETVINLAKNPKAKLPKDYNQHDYMISKCETPDKSIQYLLHRADSFEVADERDVTGVEEIMEGWL